MKKFGMILFVLVMQVYSASSFAGAGVGGMTMMNQNGASMGSSLGERSRSRPPGVGPFVVKCNPDRVDCEKNTEGKCYCLRNGEWIERETK